MQRFLITILFITFTGIEVFSQCPAIDAGQNAVICNGATVQLNASGGTTYTWTPSNGLDNANISNPIASPQTTTTYHVTSPIHLNNVIFNGDFQQGFTGFSSNYNYQSDLYPEGTFYIGTNPNNYHGAFSPCPDHTNGAGNMMIINGSGTPNTNTWCQTVSITPNTVYEFSTWATSVHPNSPAILQFSINGILLGAPFTLISTTCIWNQFFAVWNSGSNTTADICIVNQNTTLGGNDFAIDDITFSPICYSTDSVVVTVSNVVANAGSDQIICLNQSVNSTASGGTQYQWSNGANTQSINVSPTTDTTYTVTVTDNYGCSATDDVYVAVNPLPQAEAGIDQAICYGNNTTLNASGGTAYSWSPTNDLSNSSIANPIASPTITTTYTVTVTDNNGCSATDNMILTIYPLPQASAGTDADICIGFSITLNGTGGTSYMWSPGNDLSNADIANPVASPTITTTYTLTVTDNNSCSATSSMVLTVHNFPPAEAGNDTGICLHQSTILNASGGTVYGWVPTSGLSNPNIANPVASPTITTTYTVTVTDNSGCSATDNIVITVYSLPPANAGINTAICKGQNATLTASGGVTYAWNTGGNTAVITVSPDSATNYTVTVTDGNGCTQTDNVIVTVNYPPPANAGSDIIICTGETGNLSASGGIYYHWSPSAGLSNPDIANPITNPTIQTTYTVMVTDVNSCTATDAVVVSIFPAPVFSFTADIYNGCEPLLVNFSDSTISNIQTWLWDFGDPASGAMNNSTQQHPAHLYQNPGTYSVSLTVTTTDGCQKTVVHNNMITVYPNPIAAFSLSPAYGSIEYPFVKFIDGSANAISWYWNFGDSVSNNNYSTLNNPTHTYSGEGNFIITLVVESQHGCTDSTSGIVHIMPAYTIYIPNTFTPNEDGINDNFNAYGTNIAEFTMYIFDRWGKLMFETDDINVGWSGRSTVTGEALMQDVYVYKIIVKDIFNKMHEYVGHVTLLINNR